MARKSPQEKKRLSYLKQRRNTYANNRKGGRRSVRRNKRHVNRANRRRRHQVISQAAGTYSPELVEEIDRQLKRKRPKRWQKYADTPLMEVVPERLRRRARLGIDEVAGVDQKIARIKKRVRRR